MYRSRIPSVRTPIGDVVERSFVVELGVVLALLVGFRVYMIALRNVLDPFFLDSELTLSIVRGGFALAGMTLLVASVAYWRGTPVSVGVPERTEWLPVVAVVLLTGFVLASGMDAPVDLLQVAIRVSVVGVAAYTVAKTESLVTPTLVYATFAVLVTVLHASALAGFFGS